MAQRYRASGLNPRQTEPDLTSPSAPGSAGGREAGAPAEGPGLLCSPPRWPASCCSASAGRLPGQRGSAEGGGLCLHAGLPLGHREGRWRPAAGRAALQAQGGRLPRGHCPHSQALTGGHSGPSWPGGPTSYTQKTHQPSPLGSPPRRPLALGAGRGLLSPSSGQWPLLDGRCRQGQEPLPQPEHCPQLLGQLQQPGQPREAGQLLVRPAVGGEAEAGVPVWRVTGTAAVRVGVALGLSLGAGSLGIPGLPSLCGAEP